MREILSTLSDEAQNAALAKCSELGLDPDRGVVSLQESFANLRAARDMLIDAIDQGKLAQLPISIQTSLTTNVEAVGRALTGLIGGADEVVNLATAVEQLNAAMWQYGMRNLSGEVLGYVTKMNQLKQEERVLHDAKRELEAGLVIKAHLGTLVAETETLKAGIQAQLVTAEETARKITEQSTHTTEADAKATAALAVIQQTDTTAATLLAATKASNAEVQALEPRIKEFYGQIDEHRTKMAATAADAAGALDTNRTRTETLIETLQKLEDQIKVQIEKATGYSLFHSFQTRQLALARSKWFWAVALAVMLLCSVGVSLFVILTTKGHDLAFYIKLSLGLPLLFAISFCALQYGRERRLEEEYAFKSNISISLVPYQELVGKLVNQANPAEQEKFAAFIIESVNKVFTSPTERIFDERGRQKGLLTDKGIKQMLQTVEPLLKAVKER
jgi:hypothetical protein